MILIETKNLSRVYGTAKTAFNALKEVNLQIKQGQSVAIIGKSGSGKSTLMHLLALLDQPTSGQILLNGQDCALLSQAQLNHLRNKTFGFVFQQFYLNPKQTVLENVMLPLKIKGSKLKEQKALALEALREVQLEDKAYNKATDLSGGQKQRVCVARALVNQPEIIFADEPTGNLDSQTGAKIEELLFNLQQQKKITLVIVTHDQELAQKCQRQIQIKDGMIVKENDYED